MHRLIVFSILVILLSALSPFSYGAKIINSSVVVDTIKILKRKSEVLFQKEDYPGAYDAFNTIASYYQAQKDSFRYYDYRNKALNCLCRFTKRGIALDSLCRQMHELNSGSVNDTVLTGAYIKNLTDNYSEPGYYAQKLKVIDFILDSSKLFIPMKSRISILQNRILVAHTLNLEDEVIDTYFTLLATTPDHQGKIKCLMDLGEHYYSIKEYHLSNIALQNILYLYELSDANRFFIFTIIGNNYFYLKKYPLAYYFYNESLKLCLKQPNNNADLRVSYNNLGNYFDVIGNLDSAKFLYERALDISKNSFGYHSNETAFQLNNLGNYYYNHGNYVLAHDYYQNGLEIRQVNPAFSEVRLIHSLYNAGRVHAMLGENEKAMALYQQSLEANMKYSSVLASDCSLLSPVDYAISCQCLGDLYFKLFKRKNETVNIEKAKQFYDRAVNTYDSLLFTAPIEASKTHINYLKKEIVEQYLNCYLTNGNFTGSSKEDTLQVVTLLDKCHNYVLFSNLARDEFGYSLEYRNHLGYNSGAINKLYGDIEILETSRKSDLSEIYKLSSQSFDLLPEINSWSRVDFFHHYNQNSKKLSISYIQSTIADKAGILEYTLIKDTLYCLFITKNSLRIISLGSAHDLRPLLDKCTMDVAYYNPPSESLYKLSTILLAPLFHSNEQLNKLIIINEDNFITIPFDALLLKKQTHSTQTDGFLINRYDISYAYSLNHLLKGMPNGSKSNKEFAFIGFAPIKAEAVKYQSAIELKGTHEEIKNISLLFTKNNLPSKIFLDTNANSKNLNLFMSKTAILHIATHSSSECDSTCAGFMISSSDKRGKYEPINYYDLLGLTNSPDMVVLASCSSNSGKAIAGEGIRNIGRAFAISGTKYIISSRFSVEDTFSCKFMTLFYAKLITSKDVVKALCDTKRTFLHNNIYRYPAFWANYNLISQ